MKRTPVALFSAITAVALTSVGAIGVAHAQDRQPSPRVVPAATAPILLAIAGGDATITPIEGTDKFRLRIKGTNNDLTWFTDKPVRRTGHMHISDLAKEWPRVFGSKAPTSALIVRSKGVTSTFVVDLAKPSFSSDVLAITIEPIVAAHAAIPSHATDVDLFIDEAHAILPRNPAHHPRIALATHRAAGKSLATQPSARFAPADSTSADNASQSSPSPAPDTTSTPAIPLLAPVASTPASDASAADLFSIDPGQWTYHSIISPNEDRRHIPSPNSNGNSNEYLIYSLPASALLTNWDDHELHLSQVEYGVRLSDSSYTILTPAVM